MNIRRTIARWIYQEPDMSDRLWNDLKELRDSYEKQRREADHMSGRMHYFQGKVNMCEMLGRWANRSLPDYVENKND